GSLDVGRRDGHDVILPGPRPEVGCRCPQMPVRLALRKSTLHVASGFNDGKEAAMTDSAPRRIGVSIELKPHAYDPQVSPDLFEGVLARRLIAFVVDLVILAIPIVLGAMFIVASTIATLGIAGILFALLSPLYWPLIVI